MLLFLGLGSFAQVDWKRVDLQIEDSIASGALVEAKLLAEYYMEKTQNQAINDTSRAKLHFAMALGYLNQNARRSLSHLDSAYLFSKEKNSKLALRVLNAKSTVFRRLGQYEQAKAVSRSVATVGRQTTDYNLFESLRSLGIIYRELGKLDSALHYAVAADRVAEAMNEEYLRYLSMQGIANIYDQMGEYKLAVKQNHILLEFCKKESSFMYTWLNLGRAFAGLELLDSALYAYEQSLRFAVAVDDTIQLANLHGQLGELYLKTDELNKANGAIERSLYFASFDGPKDIISSAYLTKAKVDQRALDYRNSAKAALKTLALSRELALAKQEIEALDVLANSHYLDGNLDSAYLRLREYEQVKAAFNDQSRTQNLEQLRAAFEAEKKEREIERLVQENEIKGLKLTQERTLFFAIAFFVFLVIVILLVLYRQLKLRSRQRQLIMEQSLLRSQMKPHFIFNALTSIQNFVLSNDNSNAVKYLSKFGVLMRGILEASRQELIPLGKELEMIESYIELEKARFKKRLSLKVAVLDLDEEEVKVPPMTIQPFIENSLKHGFEDRDHGSIQIKISKSDKNMLVKIIDDGIGMQANGDMSKSLGIRMTRDRIKTRMDRQPIHFTNIEDGKGEVCGLQVAFKLPLVYAT